MDVLSWLGDHLADALMVLIVFLQYRLLRQQYELSELLAAKTMKVTVESLRKDLKQESPKRRTRHYCDPTPSGQDSSSDPDDLQLP